MPAKLPAVPSLPSGVGPVDPGTLGVRQRYWHFVESKLQGSQSPARVVIGLVMVASLVLAVHGIIQIVKGLSRRGRRDDVLGPELEFVNRARAVMAYPLMVNSMLRRPGNVPVPGLFIISFDPGAPQTSEFMTDVALAVLAPEDYDLSEADQAYLDALMLDEEFQNGRRRRLPPSITEGHVVYAVDIAVHPHYLPDRHLSDAAPMVPCLAEPGDVGQVRPVPYWCAFNAAPPPWADSCPLFILPVSQRT